MKVLFEKKDSMKSLFFFSCGLTSKKETACPCGISIHHKLVGMLPRHLSSRQTALLHQGMATADGSWNGGGVVSPWPQVVDVNSAGFCIDGVSCPSAHCEELGGEQRLK